MPQPELEQEKGEGPVTQVSGQPEGEVKASGEPKPESSSESVPEKEAVTK